MMRRPPRSTLFPYATLFRSGKTTKTRAVWASRWSATRRQEKPAKTGISSLTRAGLLMEGAEKTEQLKSFSKSCSPSPRLPTSLSFSPRLRVSAVKNSAPLHLQWSHENFYRRACRGRRTHGRVHCQHQWEHLRGTACAGGDRNLQRFPVPRVQDASRRHVSTHHARLRGARKGLHHLPLFSAADASLRPSLRRVCLCRLADWPLSKSGRCPLRAADEYFHVRQSRGRGQQRPNAYRSKKSEEPSAGSRRAARNSDRSRRGQIGPGNRNPHPLDHPERKKPGGFLAHQLLAPEVLSGCPSGKEVSAYTIGI